MLACPSPLPCAARAAARRRRSAAAAAAAADEPSQQPAEPSGARKSYKNLTWAATRPIHDPLVDVDEEAHLISLGVRLAAARRTPRAARRASPARRSSARPRRVRKRG